MQPDSVDDQRLAAPALGQAATEVVQVGAQVGKLSLPPAEDTAVLPPPGHPIGIDGRYGPATKTAKETSACDAVRIGIASLARERPRSHADRYRVTPEPTDEVASSRGARSGLPPWSSGQEGERFDATGGASFCEHPTGIELEY
jgi:hypothetical protein